MNRSYFSFAVVCLLSLMFSMAQAEDRVLINRNGKQLKTELISKQDGKITFRLRKGTKKYTVDISSLSDADQEFLEDWEPEGADSDEMNDDEEDQDPEEDDSELDDDEDSGDRGPKSLYPRSKEEIKEQIKVLKKGKGRKESQEQKATNLLNLYRYLCGVSYDVKNDKKLNGYCTEAAKICLLKGTLSHGFGHYTDKSNLSSLGDVVASVTQYIDDAGANNREKRGHRRWCLNPPMEKTGFGSGGSAFSAMWAMDSGGRGAKGKFWSYPGRGYFPKAYMHGTAWSYYQEGSVPSKEDIKVSIYKLRKAPEKKISSSAQPEGREIGVKYISSYMNTINFEPDKFEAGDRGIYWVRITGGGLRVGYVVEFF